MLKNDWLESIPETGWNLSGKYFCTKFIIAILILYIRLSMPIRKTEMSKKKMNFRAQITGKKNLWCTIVRTNILGHKLQERKINEWKKEHEKRI